MQLVCPNINDQVGYRPSSLLRIRELTISTAAMALMISGKSQLRNTP